MYKSFGESGVASAAGQHAPNYPMYGYYPQYYVPNHYQSGYQAQPVFPATKSFQPGSAQTVPPGAAALPNAGSPTAKKDVPAAANSHQYASMGQFTGMSQSPAYYHQPPPQQQPYSNSLGIQQGYGKGGYASPSYPQQGTSAPERSSFKDQRENASANANRTRYQGTYVAPNGTGQAAGGHNGYYNQQFAGQYQQQQYSAHYHNYGSAQQQAPHQSQTQQQQQQPRQGGYWGAQQQS